MLACGRAGLDPKPVFSQCTHGHSCLPGFCAAKSHLLLVQYTSYFDFATRVLMGPCWVQHEVGCTPVLTFGRTCQGGVLHLQEVHF